MSSQNTITIPIGMKEPGQYLVDLHQALTEVQMLIYERRCLDLHADQCYALLMLVDLTQRIVSNRHCHVL